MAPKGIRAALELRRSVPQTAILVVSQYIERAYDDAKHGEFLGCLPADHLDMIGQLLGDQPGLFNDWDYLQFYADLIGYIRDQGF